MDETIIKTYRQGSTYFMIPDFPDFPLKGLGTYDTVITNERIVYVPVKDRKVPPIIPFPVDAMLITAALKKFYEVIKDQKLDVSITQSLVDNGVAISVLKKDVEKIIIVEGKMPITHWGSPWGHNWIVLVGAMSYQNAKYRGIATCFFAINKKDSIKEVEKYYSLSPLSFEEKVSRKMDLKEVLSLLKSRRIL